MTRENPVFLGRTTNEGWWRRAKAVIPGGVDSPVRAFGSVGGDPITIVSGKGPYVFDADGHRYIDMVQSYGAILLGHGHEKVTEAIKKAAVLGSSFGMPTPGEVLLAEEICSFVTGLDKVRFVSSGTEAAMSAIRLARGATRRNGVVKFEGCYHGHSDGLLAKAGSGVGRQSEIGSGVLPGSVGVPKGAVEDTRIAPYNQVPRLNEEIAAVIVEPIAANMGLVVPQRGFLEGLRQECDRVGALLIFDEVITGWRLSKGSVAQVLGVQPDLWVFGKIIGGGCPVGAFGGPRSVMDELAPDGPVYQAGTLSGNPVAMAAGLCVLGEVTEADYGELANKVGKFARSLKNAIQGGIASVDGALGGVLVPNHSSLLGMFLSRGQGEPEIPRDFRMARALVEEDLYPKFFHAMLGKGVVLAPGPYEVTFAGLSHSERELDLVVEAAGESAREIFSE